MMFERWTIRRLPEPERIVTVEFAAAYERLTASSAESSPVYYLQGIRGVLRSFPPQIQSRYEQRYLHVRPRIIEALCSATEGRVAAECAVVVPPSSREDARPYADALLKRGIVTCDLSSNLERRDGAFRAATDDSFDAVRASLCVVGPASPIQVSSLIVIDDVFSSGRSVAATVLALRDGGFIGDSTSVLVAVVVATESGPSEETA